MYWINGGKYCRIRGVIALFFKFRIATMKSAVVKITINSSYVLIIINPFPQDSERVRARPPAARLNLLYCHGTDDLTIDDNKKYKTVQKRTVLLMKIKKLPTGFEPVTYALRVRRSTD